MQPLSGNQRPDLLMMNMSLVLRLPREIHLSRSSSNVPRLPSFLKLLQNLHVLLTFEQVHNPLRLPCKTTSERPKVVQTCGTFVHFDFDMCFAPQRRTLFCKSQLPKVHQGCVFCTFWLRNVLGATTACTFSTSQLLKVLRTCRVFSFFTCTCASRHDGVQLFISHLTTWLRTRRFSEPTFRPPGAANHWKNRMFRDFPTFSRSWIFFLLKLSLFWYPSSSLLFSSLTLPISAFHLSILSEVWLLNFLRRYVYFIFKKVRSHIGWFCLWIFVMRTK